MRILILILTLLFFSACARPPATNPEQAMRISKPPLSINDDLELERLDKALTENIERLQEVKNEVLVFGPQEIKKHDYIKSLEFLKKHLSENSSTEQFIEIVINHFDFYEVYGRENWGEVFITSYFAPVLHGSRKKTPRYSQALYKVPEDLVHVRLDEFIEFQEKLSPLKDSESGKAAVSILRGRIVENEHTKDVVPYYTRREIESGQKLKEQDIVLAWVDPIDAFFLHIQGSGTVVFEDGEELRLGYASQNGHSYFAIGKEISKFLPDEDISMQTIDKYLRSVSYKEMKEIMYKNPSYIFFREIEGRPQTSFGTQTVDGRTIATDANYFPKGALAYLEFPTPVFEDETGVKIKDYRKSSRFVLDQDTGGAIKGTHRVDLFWGRGKEAARYAGVMKNWGKLYYVVPKQQFIQKLYQ